ncbi:MAG: PsbP-like protein [Candidatus Atribacteria bacterium]|nr:PsbP-like protein [Candidatus Atribacteria bacterium]
MRKLLIFFFLVGLIISISFPALAQTEWTESVFSRGGFSLSFPADWENVVIPPDYPDPYLAALLLSPKEEGGFREQIGVSIEYSPYPKLEDFYHSVVKDINVVPGVNVLAEGKDTIDGTPAYWITYSWVVEMDEEQQNLQGLVYLFSKNYAYFRIICLAEKDNFDMVKETFEGVASSFSLKGGNQ